MKKSILFLFALFPILASCNNNERGFVNPFPEDTYSPTGFKVIAEEKFSRPLLSDEETLVNKTVDDIATFSPLITKAHIEIRERNYERAFAGVFKKGYQISNKMYDADFDIVRYGEKTDDTPKYTCRQEKDGNSTTVVDYSYGKSTVTSKTKTVHYLAKDEAGTKEGFTKYTEDVQGKNAIEQVLEDVGKPEYDQVSAKKLGGTDVPSAKEDWYEPYIAIEQKNDKTDFVFKINEATAPIGANKDDKIILVKEKHSPYGEDGIYSLPDGRQYQAMVNSLTVTRLSKQTLKEANDDPKEWYLVEHARYYEETAITSNVIEPNVPISYLSKPIAISYKEEKYDFSTEEIKTLSSFPIKDVEIEHEK